jgi:hypothetical protein
MLAAVPPSSLRGFPQPGQRVRWRDPESARAWGWEAVFGPGPYEVIGRVDNSAHQLVPSLIVRTGLGEREICEIWLALADAECG